MDEITEFRRDALEALRQPLEDGRLAVTRTRGHAVLPGRLILVAAANPCPCGFAGDPKRLCACTPLERQRYRARLSGPIRDRIDLQVTVPRQPAVELLRVDAVCESRASVGERVIRARRRQRARRPQGPLNGALSGSQLRRDALLDGTGRALLEAAAERLQLSGRAVHRCYAWRAPSPTSTSDRISSRRTSLRPCSTARADEHRRAWRRVISGIAAGDSRSSATAPRQRRLPTEPTGAAPGVRV